MTLRVGVRRSGGRQEGDRGRKGEGGEMDIARWRDIYKVIEQKVREDMKKRNGGNRKDFLYHKKAGKFTHICYIRTVSLL